MARKSKERQQPEKSEGGPCFSCRGEGRIWDHVCPSCKGDGRKPSSTSPPRLVFASADGHLALVAPSIEIRTVTPRQAPQQSSLPLVILLNCQANCPKCSDDIHRIIYSARPDSATDSRPPAQSVESRR